MAASAGLQNPMDPSWEFHVILERLESDSHLVAVEHLYILSDDAIPKSPRKLILFVASPEWKCLCFRFYFLLVSILKFKKRISCCIARVVAQSRMENQLVSYETELFLIKMN